MKAKHVSHWTSDEFMAILPQEFQDKFAAACAEQAALWAKLSRIRNEVGMPEWPAIKMVREV